MCGLKGSFNAAYNHGADADDVELEVDNYSFEDDQEFKINGDGLEPPSQADDMLEASFGPWNVFTPAPHIDSEESKQLCFALARKIMKVLTYLFMFPCILGLIILSKGSILIAVANIRPYPRTYKSIAGDNNTIDNSTFYADGYDYSDTFDLGNDTTTPSMDLTTNASLANNEYSKKTNELYFALARKIMEDLTYLFMLSCMLGLIIFINRSNNIAVTNIRPYQKTYKSRAGASRGFYSRRGRRCRRRGRQSW